MRARRAAWVVAVLGASAFACQVIVGIEAVEKVPKPAADAEAGVDTGATVEVRDPCTHVRPPGLPAVDDDPTTELPPFVIAMDNFVLLPDPDAGTQPGFDLDRTCTCDNRPGVDARPPCDSKDKLFCDGDGGVDNQVQRIFTFAEALPDLSPQKATQRIAEGKQTILAFIRKYNGRRNDRDIEVGLVPSFGIRRPGCPGSVSVNPGPPELPPYTAGWCGDDPWSVPKGKVDPSTRYPTVYARGHVNNGRMVVELDTSPGVLLGGATLELGSPIASGLLVPLGEDLKDRDPSQPPRTEREKRLWRVADGTLAGRLSATAILAAAGTFVVPGGGGKGPDGGNQHVCQTLLYPSVSGSVCANLDIAKTSAFDGLPTYQCDAISATVQFTGRPVVVGEDYDEPQEDNECQPVDGGPRDPSAFVTSYRCVTNGEDGGP